MNKVESLQKVRTEMETKYHPMPHGVQGNRDCAIVSMANYFDVPYDRIMSMARAIDPKTCIGRRGTSNSTTLYVVRQILKERNPELNVDSIKWIKWAPRPNRSALASLKHKVFTKSGLLSTYHGKLHHLQMVKNNDIIGTRGQVETLQDIRNRGNHVRAFIEC